MKRIGMLIRLSPFGLIVIASVCMADCSIITVRYHERVPYVQTASNGVEGLTGTPVALAFRKAEIPFIWKKTPAKRQIKVLRDNSGCDCLVGWFKNPDREKFAKYTHHIYQDQPQIALARADNDRLQNGISVDSVLSNPGLKLLVKDGYSYGSYLDTKIAQHKPTIDRSTTENINMLRKIHFKRGDYFFVSPEEADGLIQSSGLQKEDFKYISFSDMPEGQKRYIMCSQKVEDEVIEKLNTAITEFVSKNKQ